MAMPPATGSLTDAEVREIRREFPALERYTYFATNGLGVLPRRAVAALHERLDGYARNGVIAAIKGNLPLVNEARARVARLLGADAGEVAFCRNTSEGVLWVAHSLRLQAGDEVLAVQGEYPATVLPWLARQSRGVVTRLLPQRERRITPEQVAAAWTPRTRLLSLSFVQFNSGFRADLRRLAEVVHQRGGLLLCDAIQGLGALRLDVRDTDVDFLTAGTHKWLLGLQGLGIFYCRRALLDTLEPLHVGTGSLVVDADPEDPEAPYDQGLVGEVRRFEEGTRNYVAIDALSASLRLIEEIGRERIEARIHALTDYLVEAAERRGCRVESPRGPGEWSGIVLFAPPANGPNARQLVEQMQGQRIVINAHEGCIHMGVHFYNTTEEIDRVLRVIAAR
jgi:cysteine desulfurase / selenocysteine lyase